MNRPNIVIINPDQMRADALSHLGNPASHTRNLDALADEGLSFSQAFCQNPVCTPSRCSFMTGWYPHVAGHRTMTHMLRPHEPALLKYLKQGGYHVWMNARNDLLPAQREGYYRDYCDTYFVPPNAPEPEHPKRPDWRGDEGGDSYYSFFMGEVEPRVDLDRLWVDGACRFIEAYDEERPFCLFLPLMNPHPVYRVEEPYFSAIDRASLPPRIVPEEGMPGKATMLKSLAQAQRLSRWGEERFDELRATYLGMCDRVDDMVGDVVAALAAKGVYGQTAIFALSDHGDYTGDYGLVEKVQNSFEDCLTRVPFIVRLPDGMRARRGVSDELVELIDLFPTVMELAGLESGHTQFGSSLVPYAMGREIRRREAAFCEGGFRRGEEHCKEMGPEGRLNPKGLYYPRQSLQASDAMYNGKAIMCRTRSYKYVRRLYEGDELYDLASDPRELDNRIADPRYASVLSELKELLLDHYLDSCDAVPFDKDSRFDQSMARIMSH
jgi:Arylsulfatase A and related enzymes